MSKLTFEQSITVIDEELSKRRSKWNLSIISWLDFDDVAQIIRIHIYRKWHLYDQSRPLLPWVNRVISSQIRNIVRNIYGNYSRPCLDCSANEGNDLCAIYGKQCVDCPLYAKWAKTKKHAHDSKLPVSLEHHTQEVYDKPLEYFDIDSILPKLHEKMKTKLKANEWAVYEYCFIQHKDDEEAAKLLGYKTTEKNRPNGYKHMSNIKKSILEKAKKLIESGEIEGL